MPVSCAHIMAWRQMGGLPECGVMENPNAECFSGATQVANDARLNEGKEWQKCVSASIHNHHHQHHQHQPSNYPAIQQSSHPSQPPADQPPMEHHAQCTSSSLYPCMDCGSVSAAGAAHSPANRGYSILHTCHACND